MPRLVPLLYTVYLSLHTNDILSAQVTGAAGTSGTSSGPGGAPLADSRGARDVDLPGSALPSLPTARAAVAHLPPAHLPRHRVRRPGAPQDGAADPHLSRGVRRGVRGDAGTLRTLALPQPLLRARLCRTVPLRRQARQRLSGRREVSLYHIILFV